jgi:hypothetical protein
MYKLMVLIWFAAYVVFIIQGLRNRSGPRWLAIAGALALPLWVQSDWWRVSAGCVSDRSVAILLLWAGMTILMFVHHIVQRPSGGVVEQRASQGRLSVLASAILRVLVFLPIGWCALNAIRPYDREPTLVERIVDSLQRCLSWATVALFFLAAALALAGMVVRYRAANRTEGPVPPSSNAEC